MHSLTNRKARIAGRALALLATLVACSGFADRALAAGGGNAANAKLCQQGGWAKTMNAAGKPFAGQDACVGYAAHDGTIYPLATLRVEACKDQPYDGLCVITTGSGLAPGSVVTSTLSKNGSPVTFDWPIVQGDGTIAPTPTAHFELPCVAGNVYSAAASGTSADSLTSPKVAGIAIASNVVERTSACP
jgi:hypothetical protein